MVVFPAHAGMNLLSGGACSGGGRQGPEHDNPPPPPPDNPLTIDAAAENRHTRLAIVGHS